jgi:hypothetical protein
MIFLPGEQRKMKKCEICLVIFRVILSCLSGTMDFSSPSSFWRGKSKTYEKIRLLNYFFGGNGFLSKLKNSLKDTDRGKLLAKMISWIGLSLTLKTMIFDF